MNKSKLETLFAAARRLPPPLPEPGFENLVLAAVWREGSGPSQAEAGWLIGLAVLFTRLGWVAVVVIVACLATDAVAARLLGMPGLTDGLVQLSDQWLLSSAGF